MPIFLQEEKKLIKKGYKYIAGLDESGRGPLAGPVVAAAVIVKNPKSEIPTRLRLSTKSMAGGRNPKQARSPKSRSLKNGLEHWNIEKLFKNLKLEIKNLKIRDSKKLSPKQREKFYKVITKSPFIEWGTGIVSEKKIDKINILEATKLAMEKALKKLKAKDQKLKIDYLILDGNFKLDLPLCQKSIVKADEKVFSCTAAGIIAKVTRDRIMQRYAKKFPKYGFEKHKGYPTKFHLKKLKKHGSSVLHRKTFMPLRDML